MKPPLTRSLAFRIPALIFLMGTAAMVVAVGLRLQNSLETLEEGELSHAREIGLHMTSGLEAALRRGDSSAARATVEGANTSRNLRFAVHVDLGGEVRFASRRTLVGTPLAELLEPEELVRVDESVERRRSRCVLVDGGEAVQAMFPIFLEVQSGPQSEPASSGLLVFELDISARREAAFRRALGEGALLSVLLSALCLGLWLYLRRTLIGPLERIGAFATSIAEGSVVDTPEVQGSDELARLAQRLSEMAAALGERAQHLRESRERFRSLVESTQDWVWELDEADRFVYVSPAVETILGAPPEQWLGRAITDGVVEADSEAFLEALRGTRPVALAEAVHRHADGRSIHLEHAISPRLDAADRRVGCRGIARDVTDRNEHEESLLRSQKLEALGRLAGGVAHDFNNLLTAILSNVELARGDLARHDTGLELVEIDEIEEAARRAASLTGQLLAFSRKQILRRTRFRPTDHLSDMRVLLERLVGESCELEFDLSATGWVHMDTSHLEQIALNLVLNARDAMPGGGHIFLAARDGVAEDGAPEVWIEVADEGPGIAAEDRDRIFDPFFTTKPTGEGTGLGLSTVQGIAQTLGARIDLDSEPGRGTRFRVALPAAEAEPPAPLSSTGTDEPEADRLVGNLVLCEDQAAVRASVARLLRDAGHTVCICATGEEASAELSRRHTRGEPVDLLVTDVVMPDKNGSELAHEFRDRFPGRPILFVSGYTSVIQDIDDESFPEADFLAKPFRAEELLRVVRDLLSRGVRWG